MIGSRRILRRGDSAEAIPVRWLQSGIAPPEIAPFEPRPRVAVTQKPGGPNPAEVTLREAEAFQRGRTEGIAAGRDQASAELQPVFERLGRSMVELSSMAARIRRGAEQDLVKLSFAIARRVLHRELTIDAESISGLIKVALEKLQSREVSRVRTHPDYEAVLRTLLDRFGSSQIPVSPDPSLLRGDVLFETPHGTLDASIEAQLREIERGFADRISR